MTKKKQPRETERSKYWRRMVTEWEGSGTTQVAFCQERGLSPAAFSWWRSEFKRRDRKAKGGVQASEPCKNLDCRGIPFVQVTGLETIPPGLSSQDRIEIILASGHQIRVPQEFSSEALQRVLKVLESGC